MRYFNSVLTSFCLIFSSGTYAYDLFADALFWQATEVVDWALNNNLNPAQQDITYLTNTFNVKPGFRVGVGYEGDWDTKFYYTQYFTSSQDADTGHLTSTFLGGKSIEKKNKDAFFSSGNVKQNIHFNMFDWNLGKHFQVDEWLKLRPIVGVKGGWIDQTIATHFTGTFSISEYGQNNFNGIGPKAGIETSFALYAKNNMQCHFFVDFASSYLFGKWTISDVLHDTFKETYIVETPSRKMGALVLEGAVGATFSYSQFTIKLDYEINDWFEQYQILDDGTGEHNNDLILQGLTLGFIYHV